MEPEDDPRRGRVGEGGGDGERWGREVGGGCWRGSWEGAEVGCARATCAMVAIGKSGWRGAVGPPPTPD